MADNTYKVELTVHTTYVYHVKASCEEVAYDLAAEIDTSDSEPIEVRHHETDIEVSYLYSGKAERDRTEDE